MKILVEKLGIIPCLKAGVLYFFDKYHEDENVKSVAVETGKRIRKHAEKLADMPNLPESYSDNVSEELENLADELESFDDSNDIDEFDVCVWKPYTTLQIQTS
jgi:inorganic pyrophosphatase